MKTLNSSTRSIAAIAATLNGRASRFEVGSLQHLRKAIKGHKRLTSGPLFDKRTTFPEYAFHYGGRKELQFNIGIEDRKEGRVFRHGVAFSFERSLSLTSVDVLIPKVARFNAYLRIHPNEYVDFRMWHNAPPKEPFSTEYSVSAIPRERCRFNTFIFVGRSTPVGTIDPDVVLGDFDRLLGLYRFVESGDPFPLLDRQRSGLQFKPGLTAKIVATKAHITEGILDVALRHNALQSVLYKLLAKEHGARNIGTELSSGAGTKIDLVVRKRGRADYYEIKTEMSSRACIRAAIPQLLEYSYWPGCSEAQRLVVVGEPPMDDESRLFLQKLRDKFSLPIEYAQLDMLRRRLIES